MNPRLTPWIIDHSQRAGEGDIRRLYLPEREEAVTLGKAEPDINPATGENEGCRGYCWIVWDRKSGENVADGHGVSSRRAAIKEANAALRERGELARCRGTVSRTSAKDR